MKNQELQTIRKMVMHGLYAVTLKSGYGSEVFTEFKSEQERLFDNYESNNRNMNEKKEVVDLSPYKAGDIVYVIERDECEEPYDFSGYMFLASVCGAVIVSSFINGLKTVEEIINQHILDTTNGDDLSLYVFPEKDCYKTKEAAEQALKGGEGK